MNQFPVWKGVYKTDGMPCQVLTVWFSLFLRINTEANPLVNMGQRYDKPISFGAFALQLVFYQNAVNFTVLWL
jgi:hypothetical protein